MCKGKIKEKVKKNPRRSPYPIKRVKMVPSQKLNWTKMKTYLKLKF